MNSDLSPDSRRTVYVNSRIQIPMSDLTFTFVRSSGPGGQNVNKVNTKAVMRWHWNASPLPDSVRRRFKKQFGSRITSDGDVLISSQQYRSQHRNRDASIEILRALLLSVAEDPKRRRPTRPTRSSVRKRREEKSRNSTKKRLRKSPGSDE